MVKKLFVFLFTMAVSQHVFCQDVRQVQLISSEKMIGFGQSGVLRVIKPVFSHEGSTLAADSANFNQDKNTFDAFGHVIITQSDGTTVYSDLLNYNGNTRIALLTNNVKLVDKDATLTTNFLTYNLATRVGTYTGSGKIVNGENVLTSKNGYYFANTRDAYFRYNAEVNSPKAIIKSDTLRYNSGSKIAYFYGPTNITGKQDKTNLYTENGEYNTQTDQAKFGKNNLYTDGSRSLKGDSLFYDKNAGYGRAVKNITFMDASDNPIIMKGNLGIYHKSDSSTLVTRNAYVVMVTKDSAKTDSIWLTADTLFTKLIPRKDLKSIQQDTLQSDAEIGDSTGVSPPGGTDTGQEASTTTTTTTTTTKTAIPEIASKTDSVPPKKAHSKKRKKRGLFGKRQRRKEQETSPPPHIEAIDSSKVNRQAADSLESASDTSKLAGIKNRTDSVSIPDTMKTRIVQAFHKVKIFKSDLQAKADSAFYSYADSIIRCYTNPIIWTQGSQLSADTIYLQIKNSKLDNMLLQNKGMIASTELDSTKFNQVKGKVMTGFFKDNKLQTIYVDGNAESIYYTRDSSTYTGMNRSISSRMKVEFADNKLLSVYFIRKPEMTYYPMEKIPKDAEILENFVWKPKERPKSKEEIIPSLAEGKKKVVNKPAAKAPSTKVKLKKKG